MISRNPFPAVPKAWDQARKAFTNSILVDTPLASLAQDLDAAPWPVHSPDETPAAYIYLPYSQAVAALSARGLPPAQLSALIILLNDTNSFDQPFGEMMDELHPLSPGVSDADSPLIKNLQKLGLPEDYPLSLTALSAGTVELCRIEDVDTLGGFVGFASRLSQSVIVGGDFRELLNGLAQKDEAALARLLPLRPGTTGLHMREALTLVARPLAAATRVALVANPASTPPELAARITQIVVYFKADHAALYQAAAAGAPVARLVGGLGEPALEPVIAALLTPHLPAMPAALLQPPKRSFFKRLFGRG